MNPGVVQGVGAQFLLSVSAELMKGFIPGVSRARTCAYLEISMAAAFVHRSTKPDLGAAITRSSELTLWACDQERAVLLRAINLTS